MRSLLLFVMLFGAIVRPARAADGQPTSIVVDDFNHCAPSHFPARWESRDPKTATAVYSVANENGEQFLKAVARAQSAQIGVRVKASIADYPMLTWRWRIAEVPAGSDERVAEKNDSAAGVYVVFKGSFGGLIPRAVKYVWSAREPRGAAFPSPGYSTAQIVVLESGSDGAGEWRTETVDVAADYRRLFKAEPPELQGIAVLTDADDTKSRAAADYDDFRFLRRPQSAAADSPRLALAP